MEYKYMTDAELASIMVSYITRVDHLRDMIGRYLDRADHGKIRADQIKAAYRELKNELRETADYLWLERNRKGSVLYMSAFSPSVKQTFSNNNSP